jgi:phage terminase small subunit
MSKSLALLEDPGPGCGAAMAKLTPNQRRFVMALLTLGDLNHSQAAKMAGYNCSTPQSFAVCASQLFAMPKIQEAVHEQAVLRLASGKVMAVSQLLILASSSTNESVKLKACATILNRTGMHEVSEHRVEKVDMNKTLEEDLDQLALLAKRSNMPLAPEWQRLIDEREKRKLTGRSMQGMVKEAPDILEGVVLQAGEYAEEDPDAALFDQLEQDARDALKAEYDYDNMKKYPKEETS